MEKENNSFMERLADKIGNIMGPLAEKLQSFDFLMALTEGMQALLPVTMVGAFACLFAFIDIGGYQAWLVQHMGLYTFFMTLQSCTLTIYSLYVVVFLSYAYAKKKGFKDPIMAAPFALACFLLLTPIVVYTNIPMNWLGHSGLFSAMITSFLVVNMIKFFQDRHITIKMPAGVPHYVEKGFEVLIPGLIILPIFGAIGQLCQKTSFGSFHNIIYTIIQSPLKSVGLTLPVYFLYELLGNLAMFCGIHGSTMSAWFTPLSNAATMENLDALAAHAPMPNIFAGCFENSVLIGGYGATLGACIVMLLIAKSNRYKQVSRIAIIPQCFNIGEPFLFGVPVMMNPYLIIPYFAGVFVNLFVTYFCIRTGIVGMPTGVTAPWTLVAWIGYLIGCETPIRGFIMQMCLIVVDGLIWLPFIKILDKKAVEEEKAAEIAG